MAAPKIRPLADKVLVRPKGEEEQTAGGIVLPDTAKERPQEGEVIAVGQGKLLDSGDRAPVAVKVGDLVIYSKYGGTEITVDGSEYLIMDESSILAVREK